MSAVLKLYLRRAAEHAEGRIQHVAAERIWLQHAEVVPGAERGESLRRAAIAANRAGKPGIAESLLEKALAIHREVGNRSSEGLAQGNLAHLYTSTGRLELAEQNFMEARATWLEGAGILREIGDLPGLDDKTSAMRAACSKAGVRAFDEEA